MLGLKKGLTQRVESCSGLNKHRLSKNFLDFWRFKTVYNNMFFAEYFRAVILVSIIISLILAFALSLVIVYLYKRAVIKGMEFNLMIGKSSNDIKLEQNNEHSSHELKFALKNQNEESFLKTSKYKKLQKTLDINLIVHAISNLSFAVAWTIISLRTFLSFSITFATVLDYLVIFCWPFAFSVSAIWARGHKQKLLTYSCYIIFFIITTIYIYFHQYQFTLFQLFLPFFVYNTLPSFVILILQFSKVKTVGLTIFMFCLILSFPPILIFSFFEYNKELPAYKFINNNALIAVTVVILSSFSIAVSMVLILKKLYLAKYINEQQISIDVQLLIFSFCYSIWEIQKNPSFFTISFCLLPFIIYKIMSTLLFIAFRTRHQNKNPVKLLLLRVFALQEASRKSFQKIQVHWQFAGPVLMISGPDLATTTIDSNEMADFVTNSLKKHFCYDSQSIEKNLNNVDIEPDNDGSFRITEFFCRNNIWKEVLLKLISMSNLVLLDLRSFSQSYKGCQYEIQQVVNHMNFSKVIVLIDQSTKIDFLKATFIDAFKNIQNASPNLLDENPEVQLYSFKSGDSQNFTNLLKLLCNTSEN
ncbi:MAG: hypothetical protein ABIO55_15230 [Ginsengibacter sp.]